MESVYIISNPSRAGKLEYKIGKHTGLESKLLSNHRGTLKDPVIFLFLPCSDSKMIEKIILKKLTKFRIKNDSGRLTEWVRMDLGRLIEEVKNIESEFKSTINTETEFKSNINNIESGLSKSGMIKIPDMNSNLNEIQNPNTFGIQNLGKIINNSHILDVYYFLMKEINSNFKIQDNSESDLLEKYLEDFYNAEFNDHDLDHYNQIDEIIFNPGYGIYYIKINNVWKYGNPDKIIWTFERYFNFTFNLVIDKKSSILKLFGAYPSNPDLEVINKFLDQISSNQIVISRHNFSQKYTRIFLDFIKRNKITSENLCLNSDEYQILRNGYGDLSDIIKTNLGSDLEDNFRFTFNLDDRILIQDLRKYIRITNSEQIRQIQLLITGKSNFMFVDFNPDFISGIRIKE